MTRPRKHEFEESRYRASKRYGLRLVERRGENAIECDGSFTHPLGIVTIWTAYHLQSGKGWTRLTIVVDGFEIDRRWRREWPSRTLATLCRQFLQDHAG